MPKRIPISTAKRFAEDNDCRQVVIAAWDGNLVHVVTYGKTAEDCDNAAAAGDRYKAALGWPEHLNAKPSRLKKAATRAESAEAEVKRLREALRPFAEAFPANDDEGERDNAEIWESPVAMNITFGQLRDARKTYEETGNDQ